MSGRPSRLIVAFALVASLLVVSATPVSASHGPFVVSSHSTDTDFNNANLTNMTVVGSGESATVELEPTGSVIDSFEDQDISEYSGDTGTYSIVTAGAQDGTYRLKASTSAIEQRITSTSGLESYPSQGDTFQGWAKSVSSNDDDLSSIEFAQQSTASRPHGYMVELRDRSQIFTLKKENASGTFTLKSTNFDFTPSTWYWVEVDWQNDGTINASLYDTEGGTLLASVEAVDNAYSSGGFGFMVWDINDAQSGITAGFDGWTVNDGPEAGKTPAEYQNNHSATDTVEGFANVSTANNVSATFEWRGDSNGDGTYDTLLNQTTITAAGNYSFTWSEFSGDSVQLNLTVESTGASEAFALESEGVLANTVAPAVDNSSASPTGELSAAPSTFSIDISDGDFATSQGDSVTVEFFSNTSGSEGTDTLTANGTASVPIGRTITEPVKWWAVATDSEGHETRSSNFTATPPASLAVYNETAVRLNDSLTDAELVDEVEVEIRFLQDDGTLTIITRTATNGMVNMSGLDPTQPFIAVATADGYYDRRVFVPSLYEAQEIFMLPTSQTAVTQSFELQDFSGLYPDDETVLEIQRGLAGEWRTVEGDYFGATGEFTATLRYNGRHRLVLTNIETGETEILGTYTPISSEDKLIQVGPGGEISFVELNPIIAFSPDVNSLPATSTDLTVSVANRSTDLSTYNVTVLLRNSSGNTTLATFNGSNPAGEEFTASLDLTNTTGNVTVLVEWSTSAASGSTTEVYQIHEYFANENSLLAVLGDVRASLPSSSVGMFTSLFAVLTSVLAMIAFASNWPVSAEEAGLVGLFGLAFWAIVGWLGWPVVFASGLAWVAVTALRRGV